MPLGIKEDLNKHFTRNNPISLKKEKKEEMSLSPPIKGKIVGAHWRIKTAMSSHSTRRQIPSSPSDEGLLSLALNTSGHYDTHARDSPFHRRLSRVRKSLKVQRRWQGQRAARVQVRLVYTRYITEAPLNDTRESRSLAPSGKPFFSPSLVGDIFREALSAKSMRPGVCGEMQMMMLYSWRAD